jgi:hypothetical protein
MKETTAVHRQSEDAHPIPPRCPLRRFLRTSTHLAVLLAVVLLAGLLPSSAGAAGCEFKLGFKAIADQIPTAVGGCLEDEHPDGANTVQKTTGGLLVWRKADNFTAFTDGHRSWVSGPYGVRVRLNTERFCWEANEPGWAPCGQPAAPSPPPPTPTRRPAAAPAPSLTLESIDGSPYSSSSAYNPYASNPPAIIYGRRNVGYLTKNKYLTDAVDPDILFATYGCARN